MKHTDSLPSLKKWTAIAGACIILLAAILACMLLYPQSSSGYESTSWAMGSYVQQTLYGTGAEEAASETASAVTELENLISWRVADSDMEKLNTAAGTEWLELDARTIPSAGGGPLCGPGQRRGL